MLALVARLRVYGSIGRHPRDHAEATRVIEGFEFFAGGCC